MSGFNVWRDQGDALDAQRFQAVDQRAGAGDDGRAGTVVRRPLEQTLLGNAVVAGPTGHDRDKTGIAEDVDRGIGELYGTAVRLVVHGLQLLLGDLLHPHAGRVEGEPLRLGFLPGRRG
ncbi:hypothetical protein [Streptomyces sp. NPDC050287]|uniref:hypothetical protein n=1 Tax=Streptomyces sp. NPDC050287 TaxID=3365608 RepID=UPI0037A1F93D